MIGGKFETMEIADGTSECPSRIRRRWLPGLLVLLMAGCSGRTEADYLPSASNARGALEAALNSWKSGATLGTINVGAVPVVPMTLDGATAGSWIPFKS